MLQDDLGRRGLLLGGGALGLSLAAPAHSRVAAGQADASLLRGEVAEVILRGDRRLEAMSRPQNLAYAGTRPLAIARCAEPAHLARAIRWAREGRVPFVLRSGGHSYAGCSVTDGLLIDLQPMSRIALGEGGLVELGGGVLNRQIYAALRGAGRTITHGRCGGVGASAFLMGGGIGFGMRDRGLGCDAVRAATVMRADGTELRASLSENPELFWALRGAGGGNLGAMTGWTLATIPAEPVTFIDLGWTDATPEQFIRLVRALEASPARMGTKVSLLAPHGAHPHGVTMKLLGQLRGPRAEAMELLAPAYALRAPAGRLEDIAYWPAQNALSEEGQPAWYRETSRYLGAFPERLAEEVFARLRRWPGTRGEGMFKMFHAGGRIRDVAPGATAFVHRDAEWLAGTEVTWDGADGPARVEAALAWQRAFHWAIDSGAEGLGGSYQNFPDPGLENAAEAYYGANLARLAAVRAEVDPDHVFSPPRHQGIPPVARGA